MIFRDNYVPLPQMEIKEKRKLTKSDIKKTNHGNGLVPNGTGKKLQTFKLYGNASKFRKMETKTNVRNASFSFHFFEIWKRSHTV